MVGQSNTTAMANRIINVCVILTLAYSILCMAVFLRAKGAVSPTTSSGVDLSIAFSLPTIFIVGIRGYFIVRQRTRAFQTISPSTAPPKLERACTTCVQVLVFLWMILGCVNLLVALRAPTCLKRPLEEWQNDLEEQNWRYGLSCRLHRALVALTVLMAIFMASLLFLDQQQPPRRGASLLNCYCTCLSRKAPKSHGPALSASSSCSAFSVEKNKNLFLVPDRRPNRLEHEQWLQRRNSLSSQKAIYPHKYSCHDQRPRYHPYTFAQSSRYSSTLRSVSEGQCLDWDDRNSSLCSSQSSSSFGPRQSTHLPTPRGSRSRANSNPERGDLRRDPATISASENTAVPDVPPLPIAPPPTWSPALHHTPLSADPTIRALSTDWKPQHVKCRGEDVPTEARILWPAIVYAIRIDKACKEDYGGNSIAEKSGDANAPCTPATTSFNPPSSASSSPCITSPCTRPLNNTFHGKVARQHNHWH
ncbi:uncharacterized protein Z519_07591 [Cladophialophora bantiana CBS 173.52]|uniref:Uncharacterized protein n=1 Tax=Cladophialophora bantiana (strain ATCC 10958 / CBS 173.52 / CDC B-1940 / NIH 8579) TaxID=1442370 RepID=A0A0D2HEB0_CLAB1|nr:uncharacterized protein Z519_07591 [Cladophialophora bantiana CBS 173.52]KIW91623.1 hypothetical protein Z519_07591 [Cladophialophora bantiana CBS 173.52]